MARTMVVGDVHGCRAELEDLLEKLQYAQGDRLFFVGDLVARGPDSRGVLELVRRLGAQSVLGNHEERLLAARAARPPSSPAPRLGLSHDELLREFDDADWAQLEALPRHIDLPEHALRVVHAGVHPGLPFEQQDPWVLTHVRTIGADGVASSRWEGERWGKQYSGPPHIVFGHNAQGAVQAHPWATGVDTGCVYGGFLSALVLEPAQRVPELGARSGVVVAVAARERYVPFRRGLPRGKGADFVPATS